MQSLLLSLSAFFALSVSVVVDTHASEVTEPLKSSDLFLQQLNAGKLSADELIKELITDATPAELLAFALDFNILAEDSMQAGDEKSATFATTLRAAMLKTIDERISSLPAAQQETGRAAIKRLKAAFHAQDDAAISNAVDALKAAFAASTVVPVASE